MGSTESEIERKVSLSARNLCYGVQRIVMAAKNKSGVEWKSELLTLLGGSDEENPVDHCDVDVLLLAPKTDKFVLRCLENELPPNMIHCLRLLRVLELQHAAKMQKENEEKGKADSLIKSISSQATGKVSQLLCTLCTDASVGEQLRPHLFGLLALSGASYPASGVHVAKAASQVIIAFSERCLNKGLVTFLHERKMIIHMTDDIKELCGLASNNTTQAASSGSALSLYGVEAEEHGLWATSISTVVHLVVNSCRHGTRALLKDFEAAKGNKVLLEAILGSKSNYGKKLVELLPLLATCKVSDEQDDENEIPSMVDSDSNKLAVNPAVFQIVEELMYQSIPLLQSYVAEHDGERPKISESDSFRELAEYSLKVTEAERFGPSRLEDAGSKAVATGFDLATDLLLACLNLYSEHSMNYDMVEGKTRLLTMYILAFPTFEDENLKVLTMKTLEFVVTGVSVSNAMQPFAALSDIFVAICRALLKGRGSAGGLSENKELMMEGLFADTDLINESLEKLFQFDSRVGPAIIRSGTVTGIVDNVSKLLLEELIEKKDNWRKSFEHDGEVFFEPPDSTPLDNVCAAICRVLALIMGQQSRANTPLLSKGSEADAPSDIHYLLDTAVKELGEESASAAFGVFQRVMLSRENLNLLRDDMDFCLGLVDYFSRIMARLCGVPKVADLFATRKVTSRNDLDDIKFKHEETLNKVYLHRVVGIFNMIRKVLEVSALAKEAFRLTAGFERIVKVALSVGGLGLQEDGDSSENRESLLELFETMLSVVDSAIGFNSREQLDVSNLDAMGRPPVFLGADMLVDPISTQHSHPKPAAHNLYYLRLKGFYLDLAIAMCQTKILERPESSVPILELAMSHMDPSFSLARIDTDKIGNKVQKMRNPDAARLVLGLVLFLPSSKEGATLAKRSFDQIIRLCDPSRLGSTLTQIANCGLIWSITNPNEFASVLDDTTHPLYTRFTLLLRRIAAFSMSYTDFVSIVRGIAGPLLKDSKADSRIRLPVISSSIRKRQAGALDELDPEISKEQDADFCRRLESLCAVAERGERVPYTILGGDSINTLSVLLHKTKVEDRLYKAAEDGRLNFLEVEFIDASVVKPGGFLSAGVAASGSSGGERLWTPMATNGFSFSIWFRFPKPKDDNREGNIYMFDLANPSASNSDANHSPQNPVFISLWYDLRNQRFNLLTSTSNRGEPTSFPVSPLVPTVWHHVLLTYTPTKRTMMGRKSVFSIYVDGRPLEAEVKIESVNIAPNAKMTIGAPNPAVAVSGVVRGMIPIWELGPSLLLSTVLMELDATAMFVHGPDFQGYFWGDRPQRLSLSATGSAAFAQLAETGEPGSVASALRRRGISRMEAAGTVSREMGLGGGMDVDNDSLATLGLLCTVPPDTLLFAYRAASCDTNGAPMQSRRRIWSGKLVNMARMNSTNETVSTDAAIYGKAGVVNPRCFADNVQWAGGPEMLMPLVFASKSSKSLSLAMRLIRASTNRHTPNLETMQGGGGFQILAGLIQGKKYTDHRVVDESFAYAVHGFVPANIEESSTKAGGLPLPVVPPSADYWVFSDLDAMKQLLLNHQVWDLRNSGPDLPLRLITFMNGLVGQKSVHKAFNSRRLHLVGVVRWTLHLMIEAAELFSLGESNQNPSNPDDSESPSTLIAKNRDPFSTQTPWYCESPYADAVSVGGDPDNPLLFACKTLLRRVLTFMLTPGDLEAISETIMHTINIGGSFLKYPSEPGYQGTAATALRLYPSTVTRIYLVRLVEELIVDGVNEIVASAERRPDADMKKHEGPQPHAGGIANPNQSYLPLAMLGGRPEEGQAHPKHKQAQNFLTAFAGVFTPVWFAALLEGCHEEASSSAVLRLMMLMHQSSPAFASRFEKQGGFAPLHVSIRNFPTCPSIIISLLSQLLKVSILHLPCFPVLEASQLNEVFESEKHLSEMLSTMFLEASTSTECEPAAGVFGLLAECVKRNIFIARSSIAEDNGVAERALTTNAAILELLQYRHSSSHTFQEYCRTSEFTEPLVQLLCQTYVSPKENENETKNARSKRLRLADAPAGLSPLERLVGKTDDRCGSAIVQLLRLMISASVMSGSSAPPLVHSLFYAIPMSASTDQVTAYHYVLLDICRSTVEDAIDLLDAGALASSVGVISVLVDCMMRGFFSSEAMFITLNLSLTLMKAVTSSESTANSRIGNSEMNMISADAAHIARIASICVLRRCRPLEPEDPGDAELQEMVSRLVAKSIFPLMTLPKMSSFTGRRTTTLHPAPATTSKNYVLWVSASLARCNAAHSIIDPALYPDLSEIEEPLRAFVTCLMVEIAHLLNDSRDSVREAAITVVVALLQDQRTILSGLLVKEYQRDGKVETLDVMNRGGFGALLVAHEVAMSSGGSSVKKNYGSFFDWFEKHQKVIQQVFEDIKDESLRLFPGLDQGATTQASAVENQQHLIFTKMSAKKNPDLSLVGGLERSELVKRCTDKATDSHMYWKRQGFDDLAAGAMLWKRTLRRMKGSCSIWEGGQRYDTRSILLRHRRLYVTFLSSDASAVVVANDNLEDGNRRNLVTRWKLDLTEGYERQRRRLFPNYEFFSLYNIDENDDLINIGDDQAQQDESKGLTQITPTSEMKNQPGDNTPDFFMGDGMEATTALLKDLNLKKVVKNDDDEDEDLDIDEDIHSQATSATAVSDDTDETMNENKVAKTAIEPKKEVNMIEDGFLAEDNEHENASSYDLITGLLQAGDWPEESYNVRRCTGLEVRKALLLWCRDAIYVIDGFEQSEGEGLEGKITRVEKEESTYNVNLRPKDFTVSDDEDDSLTDGGTIGESKKDANNKTETKNTKDSSNEVIHQHRSQRIAFKDLHSVFRRRYQLQQCALEFYDIYNQGTLVAFAAHEQREEILSKILSTPLPNSIFGTTYGTSINYKKFMASWKSRIIAQWVNGKMTNFDFLMHLNSFAGRTYNDLTQYPVFPWVIADYESEELDLHDPKTFRDLSKSMGALGAQRAQQFRDRYESLEANYFNEDEPPPFHYGTHYSCAAYVLYYLMRLEPFSRLALTLQGGKFDVADRLFHNIASSWKSASEENLQDVRELIPEFYYLPDFLTNTNGFDFGTTQKGKTVHNVTLPKWAKGDPNRFIRINRQALESDYVSKNLHAWADLIFGYKQRGEEAVAALNTFVHVTYEGEVDLESMTDPVQRESTIAQIQNFGQTPTRLERRPFPQRLVYAPLKDDKIDFGALSYLAPLAPPFSVVGAPHRCKVKRVTTELCKMGLSGQKSNAVGDMCLVKGQLIGVGQMCALHIPSKTYVRFGLPNNGISVHVAALTARHRELNKLLTVHDGLHRAEISALRTSLDGRWIATGCIDSTVRVWKYEGTTVKLRATLCGHGGWKITCLDISTVFGTIVSGCAQGRVLVWDIGTLTFVRRLEHVFKDEKETAGDRIQAASSVSLNHKNGNIVTLVGPHLSVFDVNGRLLGTEPSLGAKPSCAVATDCPEWQENGVVAVTGHVNGEVRFWSLNYDTGELAVRELMVDMEHRCEITSLRVTGDNQNTLLVGDASGKMSICRTVQLENMSSSQLSEVAAELKEAISPYQQQLTRIAGAEIRSNLSTMAHQGLGVSDDIASGLRSILPGQSGVVQDTGTTF